MQKRSRFGWTEFLMGLFLIILGVFTFITPDFALSVLIICYSLVAIITGIVDIYFYVKLSRRNGLGPAISLIAGIFSILAGLMILLHPVLGKWIFNLVFAVWFISHSIARLANIRFIRNFAGRFAYIVTLILNILGILLGVIMLIYPSLSVITFGYLAAFGLVMYGISGLVEAFSNLGRKGSHWENDL